MDFCGHMVLRIGATPTSFAEAKVPSSRTCRMGKQRGTAYTCCLGSSSILFFVLGLVLVIVGAVLFGVFPSILRGEVNKKVTVVKGHATYEQLEEPSIPIYKDFYFFNLTNFEEFHDERGGVKPEFEELGPYSYSELRTKVLVETDNDSELSYTQRKIYHFNPLTSDDGLSDSDIICTINIPLIGAINLTKEESFLRFGLNIIINATGAKLYVCENVNDLIWGYTDPFVEGLYSLGLYPQLMVSIQVNDSIDDTNTSIINTGIPDIRQVGQFIQWNNRTDLGIWRGGSEANQVRGTEGFFFKPNLNEDDILTAFVDDIMRSVDIIYEGKVKQLDLTAFRYGIDNTTFKSAFSEPKNADYFSWCPDGMFFIGPTQVVEVPVYGSKPHFLDGDPLLLDSILGLEPDRELHDTVIDVEPITGANLNFQRKLQVVVQVNKTEEYGEEDTVRITENIMGYNDSGVLYFPVLYLNEHASIDEEFKEYLEDKGLRLINRVKAGAPAAFGILISLGIVCILLGFLTFFLWWNRRVDQKQDSNPKTPLLKYNKE